MPDLLQESRNAPAGILASFSGLATLGEPRALVFGPGQGLFVQAEGAGFEPAVGARPTGDFKSPAFVHSAIPPFGVFSILARFPAGKGGKSQRITLDEAHGCG